MNKPKRSRAGAGVLLAGFLAVLVVRAEMPASPGGAADSAWVAVTPARLAELTNCDPTGARVAPSP